MTDQKNKKKICWKSKLQAVCTLKATCSISLVCTIHQASTCKVCRWVSGIWTINIVLILFIHIILKNKNKNKKQIRLHAPSSRFSQTHASLASSLQTHAFLKFAVPGSTLHARYRLLPGLPIYLASSLPNPTTRIQLLIKTIPTREEPDSGAPTASNRRRHSLASSLPIQPQIGGATHNLQVLSLHRINADMGL